MKRSPLARVTPLRRVRARARAGEGTGYAAIRARVLSRAGGRCEGCGRRIDLSSLQAHHRRPRSAGRDDAAGNLLALCGACHALVHSRPCDARAVGRVIARADLRPPRMVPVLLHTPGGARWFLLGDDFSRITLTGMDVLSTVTGNTYQPGDGTTT